MPCKHTEDVCQRCLRKVQREDSSEEEEEEYSPKKTNRILIDSALLAGLGYTAFYSGKFLLEVLHYGVSVAKDILENLLD